jgi:hypothetical protein
LLDGASLEISRAQALYLFSVKTLCNYAIYRR